MVVSYNKLWHLLIDKKMNKTMLQKSAGITWASISKMTKDENVSTEVLVKICNTLNCGVSDIMEIINNVPMNDFIEHEEDEN